MIAMLAGEPEASLLAERLQIAEQRLTSPLVRLETVMRLATMLAISPGKANEAFDELLDLAKIRIVDITDEIGRGAVDAFARYGKGQNKPGKLNLADCLTYAAAKTHRVSILYKGDDFAQTDLA